jgi:uncharacterized protein (TIGR00369 family)
MSLWPTPLNLEKLNQGLDNTLCRALGMEYSHFDEHSLSMRMPVDGRTHQPFGLLHGGATAALAESVASTAANCIVAGDGAMAVGQEINCNHLRAATEGWVDARATALHIGQRSHVWEIRVHDQRERLIAVSRLTMAIVRRRERAA